MEFIQKYLFLNFKKCGVKVSVNGIIWQGTRRGAVIRHFSVVGPVLMYIAHDRSYVQKTRCILVQLVLSCDIS